MRYVNIYSSARWVAEYETYHILTPEDISDIDIADAIMIRFPVIFKNTRTHTFEHAVKIWSHQNACLRNRCPFDWICGYTNCACFLTPAYRHMFQQKNRRMAICNFTVPVSPSSKPVWILSIGLPFSYRNIWTSAIWIIFNNLWLFHDSFNNIVNKTFSCPHDMINNGNKIASIFNGFWCF